MPDRDGTPDVCTLRSRVVYTDPWIRLRKDDIRRRDGSRGTYAVVEKPPGAIVVPAEHGGFHLVEEYRYPIRRRTWSFPQGSFPAGMVGDPEQLAHLELAQETGLRARRLARLGCLHPAHGITDQVMHIFLATDLTPGRPEREPEEQDMRQQWVTRRRFEEMIDAGLITDDATVAAYALLLLRERRGT